MTTPIPRMIRLPELKAAMGLGATAIYERVKDGLITPPVKLTKRSVAWPESEIATINRAVIAGLPEDELRKVVEDLVVARSKAQPEQSAA